jgi:hypothetical protein
MVGVFLAGRDHGMNQEIRGGTTLQCIEQSGFVGKIELDDAEIGMIGPRAILKFAR